MNLVDKTRKTLIILHKKFTTMGIGLKIKELAEQRKVDAVWIAKRLGKTKQAVYDIFSKEDVNTSILKELANAFGVPVSYFFDEEDIHNNSQRIEGDNNVVVGRDNNGNGNIERLQDCR
ncbi:MAG: helix-turn-helix transcriptional regulator, partial [Mucinivorans sp.]